MGLERYKNASKMINEEMLKEAAKRGRTKHEVREQMVSAVMSGIRDYPSTPKEREAKRDEIRRFLTERHGW